ncbi:MAG: hypothetical protein AB1547_13705 [Thermodesulfobacteriota bacterium]
MLSSLSDVRFCFMNGEKGWYGFVIDFAGCACYIKKVMERHPVMLRFYRHTVNL